MEQFAESGCEFPLKPCALLLLPFIELTFVLEQNVFISLQCVKKAKAFETYCIPFYYIGS